MSLIGIARIYVDLVELDNKTPETEYLAKEEISLLRSKYHQLFMDQLQEQGIEYADRFDAMNKAFDLVRTETSLMEAGNRTRG